ncbi:lycopene beta-cyclase CrtY [Pseudomonas sp. DTU_2021_1001937_2_SI_NGA_ILE_001]|uniref:lycopene beta-cyclase CrtY n=1 Tax=Pseudomonas sp. DTU_2021_1001937_2_SI_NGA_ILE_001 TaxID=3077589 RepID=UPI0028FC21CB|nr:lycopene beta-cyclase CrtY [Pseudomonas sp. DTU_2021_1001937_2_SI_NGA_ILE_001]WNW10726.1 lycopene beta-cyclase CrtY [Pseudomonas sp. DTU_2021_1001937_2_SI_NGA_ILE_001]
MSYDLILAGAGLANGLIALRLKRLRPELRILCVEQQPEAGGNHTWSFHEHDLSRRQRHWIEPLIVKSWPAYDVHFPQLSRRLHSGYASITSERFASVLQRVMGDALWTGRRIEQVTPHSVILEGGERLQARAVIDGRGLQPDPHLVLGRQAFLGQVLRLQAPHGLEAPIIMDARVAQEGGYRFVYVLPFSSDTLLIEDTHYVDRPLASAERLRQHIIDYATQHGWQIAEVLREETGVLPITLAGDFDAFWGQVGDQPLSGLRAGLFHCTTGYSLPEALRLADWLAGQSVLDAEVLASGIREHARRQWQRQGFYRLLNRMLFLAGRAEDRWQVMQRFYRLPEGLIGRFYAGDTHALDKLRILFGKPPVPVGEALRALLRHSPRHFENTL